MWKDDDFDDPRKESTIEAVFGAFNVGGRLRTRSPFMVWVVTCTAVIVTAGVLWYSYPREAERQELAALPTVHADAGPYKVAPADPGGMEIPYRDSTVFETLRTSDAGADGEGKIENLLPEPEKPVERPDVIAAAEVIASPVKPAKEDVPVVDVTETVEKTTEPSAPTPVENVEVREEKIEKVAEAAAKTEPAAGTAAKIETKTETQKAGGFLVQLGSVKSDDAARQTWKSLTKTFPAQLDGLDLKVQKADLGEKGVFYRVQAGPVDETQAKSICQAVAAKKPGGCLVVRN